MTEMTPLSRLFITMVTAEPVERFHAYFRRPQEADSITIPMLQVEKPRAEESEELVKSALSASGAGRSCFLWAVIVTVASNIS